MEGKRSLLPSPPLPPPPPPRFAQETLRLIGDREGGNNNSSRKINWWKVNFWFEEPDRGRNNQEKTFRKIENVCLAPSAYEAPACPSFVQ